MKRPSPNPHGRPRLEDAAKAIEQRKPWLTGETPMSRSTWYRRQAEKRVLPVCRICGQEGHRWQRCGSD